MSVEHAYERALSAQWLLEYDDAEVRRILEAYDRVRQHDNRPHVSWGYVDSGYGTPREEQIQQHLLARWWPEGVKRPEVPDAELIQLLREYTRPMAFDRPLFIKPKKFSKFKERQP